tara:strand:+ start:1246 stop:1767 length:522 start_codon:yes stop_codon:yes gene_type:complete
VQQYKFNCCGRIYNARRNEVANAGVCPFCKCENPHSEEVDKHDRVITAGSLYGSHSGDDSYEERPWGNFKILLDTPYTKVKRITVNPNARLSLQYHNHRSEVWTIVSGYGKAQVGESNKRVKTGSVIEISAGEEHRAIASEVGMTFIEVQLSDSKNFSEDDIVRIEDDYGRTK